MKNNTLNICLSHVPPPQAFNQHVDILMSPNLLTGAQTVIYTPDYLFDPHGDTLSEYAQLLWLSENFSNVCANHEFVRIFHYRRFTSLKNRSLGKVSLNLPWARVVSNNDLEHFESDFTRHSTHEIYNSLTSIPSGVLGQYSDNHLLTDYLDFTRFLIETQIMTTSQAVNFLRTDRFIPSCNIGIFESSKLRVVLNILAAAAEFRKSEIFKRHLGSQRRSMGFLLERLHSFLLLQILEIDGSSIALGQNFVIADDSTIKATI